MKIYKPYFVQRCESVAEPRHDKKISENIKMDYMGSSEFEFGALPRSLRQISADLEKYHTVQVKEIKNLKGQPLIVWSKIPFEQLPEYVSYLVSLRNLMDCYTKERTNFDVNTEKEILEGKDKWTRTNFWWDLDNDVMFSFKPDVMKVLADSIRVSIEYMDEARRQNAIDVAASKYNR